MSEGTAQPRHALVSADQLRAARAMAGMTQKDLASALGIDERQIRFWERQKNAEPTNEANSLRIQRVFADRGVILVRNPIAVMLAPVTDQKQFQTY